MVSYFKNKNKEKEKKKRKIKEINKSQLINIK